MNDPKARNLTRLERACFVGALAALALTGATKSGAGDGIIMGRYQATPPTLSDGAPMDLLLGPRAELIVGTSSASSLRVQGTTEDGVAPLTSEDAPVLVGGRDPNTGLEQTIQTDGSGGLAITTSAAGAGVVTAATPRVTLATDDVVTVDGSAGAAIQQGAGAVSAATVRVTQATDDLVPMATTTDGGAASARVMTVGGFDGATAQQLLTAASGALRVDPTGTTTQPVSDAAGSLTVDAPVGTPVFTRLSDGAAAQGTAANPLFARLSDGADSNLVTAAGELNVLATAQPGVDIGDVTLTSGTANVGSVGLLANFGGTVVALEGTTTNGLEVDVTRVPAPLSTTGGGTEAAALRVTVASDSTGVLALSELPAPAALADNAANPTTTTLSANTSVWDGATWDRAPGDSANGADVDVTRMPADATELPVAAALADGTANPTITSVGAFPHAFNDAGTWDRVSGDTTGLYVQGPTTSDGVLAARPLTIGGRASTANPAAVSADGNAVNLALSRIGSVKITGGTTATVDTTARTADVQLVAANTGNRLVWFSVRESAAAAATATIVLRHGTLVTSPAIAYVELTANESTREPITVGLPVPNGVFLDIVTGEIDITVWTEDHE